MAFPLAGQMSNLFRPHRMDSQYDYPNIQEAQSIKPSTAPRLTPYLGHRSRLSQIWFNKWTILLALVVVRVWISTYSLEDDIESTRREALSACTAVERAGSAMASMPHYLAPGVNELSAKMIEGGVRALHKTIGLTITGVQEIVVFVINMMISTYLCLITLAVTGAASVVLDATKEIMSGLNDTIKAIADGIANSVNDVQGVLDDIGKKVDQVGSFFGSPIQIPKIELPGLNDLRNIKIPQKYMEGITKMEKSLETVSFDDVKKATEDVIRAPFKLLRERVEKELGIYEFDRSIFPVPPKEKLTFCSKNNDISNFFDKLKKTINRVRKIVLGLLIAAAILVMIPMGYLEHRRWKVTRERAYMFSYNAKYDPVDIVNLAARPSTGTFGMRIASHFSSDRRQILVRWAVAYATSPAALFVLSLGVAGLISAVAQFVVLRQVEASAPGLAQQVGNFAGDVVDFVNNASVKFAQSTNNALVGVQDQLNDEMFGWLTEGTESVNNTLNTFTHGMQSGVKKFLGGTPLEGPANDVIRCIIGLRIENLQKGLTWLHDNIKISLPPIPEDTFSKGAMQSLDADGTGADSFLSDPQGASSDMITDTLLKMANKWKGMIMEEAAISGGVCLVWLLVVMIAVARTLWLWWGRGKTRAEGGGVGTVFSGGAGVAQQAAYPTVDIARPITPSPAYPGHELNPIASHHDAASSVDNNPFHDRSYPFPGNGKGNISGRNVDEDSGSWSEGEKKSSVSEDNHSSRSRSLC